MKQINIEEIDIPKGTHKRFDINIARLPSHTLIDMPVFIFKGKEHGPRLLLTAGIHGDEINGIAILRKLIADRYLQPDKGTVIAIPLVNIYGFLQNSRELPDGRDLNRSFPGTSTGSIASQIAYIMMNDVVPFIDFGIDFHTGGSRLSNYPQIRCVTSEPENMKLAQMFAPPFILHSTLIDKSFRKEASSKGKPILVYEAGESLRLDDYSIMEGIEGTKRLMHHLDMKPYEHDTPREPIIMKKTRWVRAKVSGIFNIYTTYGAKVKENQILAHITDPYGSMRITVKSPSAGYVIGLNNMPVVNSGDALVHIGTV
jgi:uncharacterized protein